MKHVVLLIVTAIVFASNVFPATSVTQWGITWYFSADKTTGQFANGDYWVLGPVGIDSITPHRFADGDGIHHGWQVNPLCDRTQGFDERIPGFSAGLIPDLPYTAQPGESIIKCISLIPCASNCYPGLKTAAVLTVVGAVPPDSGAAVFRPPYVADDKPYYATTELCTDLLPSLAPVPETPVLTDMYDIMKYVRMDHIPGNTQHFRPDDNLPDYAADINLQTGNAILRLMLDDPIGDKLPLITVVVQCGIDYFHFLKNGQRWPAGGGEQPGNILPILFASVMLDREEMKDSVRNAVSSPSSFFPYEIKTLYRGEAGRVLWGHQTSQEETYWAKLLDHDVPGTNTLRDPYGYIDGGYQPGGVYQDCCTSQPFKSTALCLYLMPELRAVWGAEDLLEYADRWVAFGTWTQPDPCAPATVDGTYGVDYGSDPDHPGDCIRDADSTDGIGRFPDLHGTNRDGGLRKSTFAALMWGAYRGQVALPAPVITPGGGTYTGYVDVGIGPRPFGVTIRYTTDGSQPDTGSTEYTGGFRFTSDTNLKARSFRNGSSPSPVAEADFTILPDTAGPLIDAILTSEDSTLVRVVFTEELDPGTAAESGNYSLDNGVAVLGVGPGNEPNTVILTVSGMLDEVTYTLTVNGIRDIFGNAVQPGTRTRFTYSNFDPWVGLTGYWNFNTDSSSLATDHSILANHGTITGASFVPGYLGRGLSMTDGDKIALGHQDFDIPLTNAFTVACWIYVAGHNQANDCFISQPYINPFQLAVTTGGLIHSAVRTSSADVNYLNTTTAIPDSEWHHVALTYRDGERVVYIDGTAAAANSLSGTVSFPRERETTIGGTFTGILDEFRIYNRALDTGRIAKLYADSTVMSVHNRHPVSSTGPEIPLPNPLPGTDFLLQYPGRFRLYTMDGSKVLNGPRTTAGMYILEDLVSMRIRRVILVRQNCTDDH